MDYSLQLQQIIENQENIIDLLNNLDIMTSALKELCSMFYLFIVVSGTVLVLMLMYSFIKKFI